MIGGRGGEAAVYTFAIVVLLGLAIAKVVDIVGHLVPMHRAIPLVLALAGGVGIAWAADYSMFAAWDITLRQEWMGPVGTGLVIGGLAAVWHEVLHVLSSFAKRTEDQAVEIERRYPRAA